MEGRVVDPYEQQLYAVFESCDEGQTGSLDRNGLEQLCEQLQLEEQSAELIECLLGNSGSNKRVSFSEFRDGLLALLGEGQKTKESGGRGSPEREVSPKFVFGKKKYGRRSRPENTEQDLQRDASLEESDTEIFVTIGDDNKEIIMRSISASSPISEAQHPKKRKTSSEQNQHLKRPISSPESKTSVVSHWSTPVDLVDQNSESTAPPSLGPVGENEEECLRAAWERLGVGRDGYLDRTKLALACECIGMERFAEEVVQQLFEKLDIDHDGRISFEEFLLLFCGGGSWSSVAVQNEKSNCTSVRAFQQRSNVSEDHQTLGSISSLDPNNTGMVSADALLEAWEAAGVPKAVSLLHSLGLTDTQQLNVCELSAVLEDELRSVTEERQREESEGRTVSYSPYETLLQATLALYQLEVRCLKSSLEHMSAERDKLRADIVDANERASLLAQEVDDHHARLEESSQLQVKMLEQRHVEQMRQVTEQLGSEREQLAVQSQALEQQVATLQEEEMRIRSELSTLQTENESLYRENQGLLEQLSESKEVQTQLQEEVESMASLQEKLRELEGSHEQEQVLPLVEKVKELQTENTGLRDRIDELTMEMENMSARLTATKLKKPAAVQTSFDASEDSNFSGGGTKRRGDSPLSLPVEESSEEESPRLGKVRRCCRANCKEPLDMVNMEGLQIHSLGHSDSGPEADVDVDESETLYGESSFRETESSPVHCGSRWLDKDISSPACEDSKELARLRLAELEHNQKLQADKRLVFEEERERLSHLENQSPRSNSKLCKGQLKQVFKLVREQALQELLEDGELMSSLQRCYVSQRLPHSGVEEDALYDTSKQCTVTGLQENAKDVEQLQQHCRDLKSQLDQVKIEIVKILSEKKACSKENCALKIHISDLKNRLPMEDSISCPLGSEPMNGLPALELDDCVHKHDSGGGSVETMNSIVLCNGCSEKSECRLDEENSLQDAKSSINVAPETDVKSEVKEDTSGKLLELQQQVKELTAKLSEEEERGRELDASLELLRQEYEKCEDYWANKLEEERHLYDQEQRLSDEKYAELMAKIREYEEQCGGAGAQDNNSEDSDDRLSTIEERASLEKQVTDLEEECEELRLRAELEQAERDEELKQLREHLQVMERRLQHSGCHLDVAVQVSDLENGSWESDRTFVVELDGVRRACHKSKDTSRSNKSSGHPVVLSNGYSSKNRCEDSSSSSPDAEVRRLQELKAQLDEECRVLKQQREILLCNTNSLHNGVALPFSVAELGMQGQWHSGKASGQACRVDLSVLQALNSRLRQQEQHSRHLQQTLKRQQQHTDTLLRETRQQHKEEVSDLQSILTSTQECLLQERSACKEKMEQLARTDMLVKELYVENAYLVATVQRLEQRCHVLAQMTSDSSSV